MTNNKKNKGLEKKDLFPLGMGTWGIGGFAEKNPQNEDEKQIAAMSYMLSEGVNVIEATYWYSEGKAVELIAEAIKDSGVKREKIFLSSTIYSYRNPTLYDAENELETVLKTMNVSCLDTVQFSLSALSQWGKNKSKDMLNKWLNQNKTRFISVTNFDLLTLKEFKNDFGESLFSHEVVLNFEIRENQELGIIDYAINNSIANFLFQPLRRNRTALKGWDLLARLSDKYHKTQNQIILNWLVWKKCIPLVKSETVEHIDENLKSLDFVMSDKDYVEIDTFRPPNWKPPKIDWHKTGEGQPIFMFPNIFDELYEKL